MTEINHISQYYVDSTQYHNKNQFSVNVSVPNYHDINKISLVDYCVQQSGMIWNQNNNFLQVSYNGNDFQNVSFTIAQYNNINQLIADIQTQLQTINASFTVTLLDSIYIRIQATNNFVIQMNSEMAQKLGLSLQIDQVHQTEETNDLLAQKAYNFGLLQSIYILCDKIQSNYNSQQANNILHRLYLQDLAQFQYKTWQSSQLRMGEKQLSLNNFQTINFSIVDQNFKLIENQQMPELMFTFALYAHRSDIHKQKF